MSGLVRTSSRLLHVGRQIAPAGMGRRAWMSRRRPRFGFSNNSRTLLPVALMGLKERPADRHARMRTIVGENVRFVARALRRAGVPRSELDDEIQRTFIAVAGR